MRNFGQLHTKPSFSVKKSLYLCVLLISLLCTQWIGLWHSVSHADAQIQKASVFYIDGQDDTNSQHGGASCQLLDNLALGSFIHSGIQTPSFCDTSTLALTAHVKLAQASQAKLPYQSRAPPTISL